MPAIDTAIKLRALEKLLDTERNTILQGELGGIARLIARKEALLTDLAATAGDAEILQRIRDKAGRNTAILGAALKGVRSAMQRLQALRTGHWNLNTYDKSGRRLLLGTPATRTLEKKA